MQCADAWVQGDGGKWVPLPLFVALPSKPGQLQQVSSMRGTPQVEAVHSSVSGKASKGAQELQEARMDVLNGRLNQRKARTYGLLSNYESYDLVSMAAANAEHRALGQPLPYPDVPTPSGIDYGEKHGFDWLRPGEQRAGLCWVAGQECAVYFHYAVNEFRSHAVCPCVCRSWGAGSGRHAAVRL